MNQDQVHHISFTGGMDLESDLKDVQPGDYVYAMCFRNAFTESKVDGSGNNVSSNIEIPYELPEGTNKCIGRCEDPVNNTVFYHIYNSNNNHRLLRFYAEDNTIEEILGGSYLNSTEWDYVTHANLVDNLYYWVEGDNPQRQINVNRANNTNKRVSFKLCFGVKGAVSAQVQYQFLLGSTAISNTLNYSPSVKTRTQAAASTYAQLLLWADFVNLFDFTNKGEYIQVDSKDVGIYEVTVNPLGALYAWYKPENWYPVINLQCLDVCAWPAVNDPGTALINDTSFGDNFLNGKAYQFRTEITYQDGQVSTLSHMSRMVYMDQVPVDNGSGGTRYAPVNYLNFVQAGLEFNCIAVNYNNGGLLYNNRELVKSVEIFVRNTNTEQFRSCAILQDYELDGTYYFYNNTTGAVVSANRDAKIAQAIPLNSKTQEVVNGKLFYMNNLRGYDSTNLDANVFSVSVSPRSWDTKFCLRPKQLGQYRLGVVYYDRLGRNGFVNTSPNMDVSIPAYPNIQWNKEYDRSYVVWELNNTPPDWAETYSVVRTKELTMAEYWNIWLQPSLSLNPTVTYYDVYGSVVAWNSGVVYSAKVVVGSGGIEDSGYEFTAGDMIRIYYYTITAPNDGTYDRYEDHAIISFDPATHTLNFVYDRQSNPSLVDLSQLHTNGKWMMGQAYTPYKQTENELYYEVFDTYAILDPHTPSRRHASGYEGQEQIPGTQPASGYMFFGWDTFQLDNHTSLFTGPYTAQESDRAGLYTDAPALSGIGRANAVNPDNKQKRLESEICFSDVWNVGALYNGFGTWEALNARNLPVGYGPGAILKNVDNILVAVLQFKSFSIYVDQGVIVAQDGSTTVSVTDKVIGAVRHLNGQYGTINPESWGRSDGLLFWWDAYSGVVCQYSNNGIDEISKHKTYTFFQQQGRLGVIAQGPEYKVLGVVHVAYNEYILSFPPYTINSQDFNPFTISFDFINNRWRTFYPFIPEMMCGSNVNIVTWVNGQLFLHTLNDSKNIFYGAQYNTEVTSVVNSIYASNKTFKSISVEATDFVNIPVINTVPSPFNPSGQASELLVQDFEFMNGSYWAAFLKNKITPNFATEAEALIEGDELQATIMTLLFSASNNTAFWIRNAHVYYTLDQLTN